MSREEEKRRGAGDHAPEAAGEGRHEAEEAAEQRARLAARRHFRAAPPYCIRFEADGRVSLRRKRYSYWGEADPAAATRWEPISYHADLEAAEQRLRHITSPTSYYDAHGRLVAAPRHREAEWDDVPEDDED